MKNTDSPPAPSSAAVRDSAVASLTHRDVLDAHGYDPDDYDWVPVLKKKRSDGWSPEKQRRFIAILSDSGSVRTAAYGVTMTPQSAYALRRSAGAEGFAAAWEAAIGAASNQLIDVAVDRAINGVHDPVFNRDGQRIASRVRYNDRLLMFLLRAHAPARFRHANRDARDAKEALPPPFVPVAQALLMIDPVRPLVPHETMVPEALDVALQCAEILDGKLFERHRDPDLLPMERPNVAEAPLLGQAFEDGLDAVKHANAPESWHRQQREREEAAMNDEAYDGDE